MGLSVLLALNCNIMIKNLHFSSHIHGIPPLEDHQWRSASGVRPGRIISISIDLRIDLPGWRGSTGDIPPMAGLYWRIYYQIENPRIGDLQWRSSTGGPPMAGYCVCEGWNGDGGEILMWYLRMWTFKWENDEIRIHTWYLRMWTFRLVYFISNYHNTYNILTGLVCTLSMCSDITLCTLSVSSHSKHESS